MDIRPYVSTDRAACLAVFDSNFPAGDASFTRFLETGPGDFYVAEHDGEIVGCGGFAVDGATARLHWGMVHRKWQRQGLGRFLLFYRMREITRRGAVQIVGLTAPRQYVPFFLGQGFREAAGDEEQAEMVKRLTVCA